MWVVGLSRGGATNPEPSQRRCKRPVAGRDVAPRLNDATQVDSSDDSRQLSDELLDALERDLTVVVPKRRARRVFNDVEAPVHLSRGRFQVLSSDDEGEESIMKMSCQHKSIGKAQQRIRHLSAWQLQYPVLLMAVGLPRWSPED